jgi:hypothetical protein
MKQLIILFIGLSLVFVFPMASYAVEVKKVGDVTIKTDMYTITWGSAAQTGYKRVDVAGVGEKLLAGGDSFYHAADYHGGWKFWGGLKKSEITEQSPGKAVVKYVATDVPDGGVYEYNVIATYWDGVPYFKHEVYVENVGKRDSGWPTNYDPMLNPGIKFKDMKTWADPIPHVAYMTDLGNFGALYAPKEKVKTRLGDWTGAGDQFYLDHSWYGALLPVKAKSETITYYVAFSKGGEAAIHDIAAKIKEGKDPQAVEAKGKLPITWGQTKAQR